MFFFRGRNLPGEGVYWIQSRARHDRKPAGPRRCIMPTMKETRDIARQLGIRPTRMEKVELIRSIQRAEGNFDCFGTAAGEECSQEECLWREECFRVSVAEEIR